MKKKYLKPEMECVIVKTNAMLMTSTAAVSNEVYNEDNMTDL